MTLKHMWSCLYLKVLDNFFSLTLRSITFVDYFTSYLYHYHFDLFFHLNNLPLHPFHSPFLLPLESLSHRYNDSSRFHFCHLTKIIPHMEE